MVIREWECKDCGSVFESSDNPEDVACPNCSGEEPERVFLTPPSIKSPQTARKDEIQKDLAQAHGLSDMSNRDGAAVKSAKPETQGQFVAAQPAVAQALAKLGSQSDGFSPVLPLLQAAGRPHQWHKRPIVK